jgi:hypothetical protein
MKGAPRPCIVGPQLEARSSHGMILWLMQRHLEPKAFVLPNAIGFKVYCNRLFIWDARLENTILVCKQLRLAQAKCAVVLRKTWLL